MKTNTLRAMAATAVVASLVWTAATAPAQNSSVAVAARPAAAGTPVPQLADGVAQILKLEQAGIGDDTIIAYLKNSGLSYGLDADQIIYLKQQGVSDAIISAMLTQPRSAVSAPPVAIATPASPAPPPVAATADAAVSTATVAPTVTYVQTAPATTYYYQPYYYPVYGVYPAVSLSFGWGGGWHGGGYYGGWHGGGWHH